MAVMQVLRWLLLVAEILIAMPILYVCILSVTAILITKKRKAEKTNLSSESPHHNFALLVPAHNEELLLVGNLLESLSALAYPKDQYTVYVVADNCTDKTAELARAIDGYRFICFLVELKVVKASPWVCSLSSFIVI